MASLSVLCVSLSRTDLAKRFVQLQIHLLMISGLLFLPAAGISSRAAWRGSDTGQYPSRSGLRHSTLGLTSYATAFSIGGLTVSGSWYARADASSVRLVCLAQ